MVLLKPSEYAEAMADLFCTGATSVIRPKGKKPLSASPKVLLCRQSSQKDEALLFDQPTHISAADFIFAASLASSYNFLFDPCGSAVGQGQAPHEMEAMAIDVFGLESIHTFGGISRQVGRTVTGRKHHFSEEEWNTLIHSGRQVMLTIRADLGEAGAGIEGITNHWVVLTRVLRSEDISSSGCAAEILRHTPACVVWTWGKYYVWESCDNLRKSSADSILLTSLEHEALGPRVFERDSEYLQTVGRFLAQMWRERGAGLHGLWPGSSIVSELDPTTSLQIVSRTDEGQVTVKTDDEGERSFMGASLSWRGSYDVNVTRVALKGRYMKFGSMPALQFVPKVLLGKKQKTIGFGEENYASCHVQ